MKDYVKKADEILPSLTDEAIRNEVYYKNDVAAALRRIPAEYRQSCVVEHTRRTLTQVNAGGGLIKDEYTGRSSRVVWDEILNENGW